jgi:hypothetical protein
MKKILLLLMILPLLSQAQSKVSGVVTYFFNKYQGDKADIGSKVYLITNNEISKHDINAIDSFQIGKTYRKLYSDYILMKAEYLPLVKQYEGKKRYKEKYDEYKAHYDDLDKSVIKYYNECLKYGVETDEKFKILDERVFRTLYMLTESAVSKTTVDGVGNYSILAAPGVYYILIVSKNRTGTSISDVMGKFYLKRFEIKTNENVDMSCRFDLY